MIRKLPLVLAAGLVLALAPGAAAIGVTDQLDPVLAGIEARQTEFRGQGDRPGRRRARLIGRAARILKRRSLGRSLITEIAGAMRAAGLIEARFPEETDILSGFRTASDDYAQRILANTGVLEAQTQEAGLRRRRRRVLNRRLAQAQAGLAAAADAETVRQRLLAQLRVARATRGAVLTGDDYFWVVATLSVTDRASSLGDNALADAADALGDAGVDLDTLLSTRVFTSPQVLLLELWAVDQFTADPLVFASALNGLDGDGNASDNFSGSETFSGDLVLDGHGAARATTALDGGAYDVELTPTLLTLGGLTVETGNTLRVAATATESTHSGRMGFAVKPGDLFALVTESGAELDPAVFDAVEALLDVDTDGDEQPDALSATLSFSCVRANVTGP